MAAAPGAPSGSVSRSHGGLEGSHGILYVCGEKTCGKLTINESLLGRKLRGIHGGYDQFVAIVDAWELEWEQSCHSDVALEHETVNDNLQHVKIHQVATGKQHRLALSLDGQIFSWGARDSALQNRELGQVGGCNGPRLPKSSSKQSQRVCTSPETGDDEVDEQERQAMCHGHTICQPRSVHTSKELFFRRIACGRSHGAAITDKGDLYTWGRNFEGQLGHFSRTLSKETNSLLNGICAWPKYVSEFLSKPRVTDVCCGEMFTVVLLENGAVYTFGERFTGITRHPEAKWDANPHLVIECGSDGAGFVGIACGFAHALVVSSSGQLYSWGSNTFGQLGLGVSNSMEGATAVPTRVEMPGHEWSKVFAGGNYSAAITNSGELFTWGNGKHGQLAHEAFSSSATFQCEYTPKCVEELQSTVISSVVCCQRNLYAFAPTHIMSISPVYGEITGGYELRIKGSGLWASEDLTVRFMPLTEGRLPRGSLGIYHDETQEIVCQVPKFSLPGEFAIEIAMNGRHFTSNGNIFCAFKRPQVTAVSIYEAKLDGGEPASITIEGNLPKTCLNPIVRFLPYASDNRG
uniref:IPT/TIG domain-containing protein n=1 Tax=Globisporangium ultimum (strain ATCC 200006 / CBS 805.95 / DAOM BR144) TaxID=431595 RepID=K3WCF6_GLOUD